MRYSFAAAALLSSAAVVSAQGYNHPLYSRDHEVYARNPMAAGIDPMNYMSTELYGRMAEPEHDAVAASIVRAREASDLRARKAPVLRRSIPQRQNKRRGIPNRRVQRRNKTSAGGYGYKEPMPAKGHPDDPTPNNTDGIKRRFAHGTSTNYPGEKERLQKARDQREQREANGIKRRFAHDTTMNHPGAKQQMTKDPAQLKSNVASTENTAPTGDATAFRNSQAGAGRNAGVNANAGVDAVVNSNANVNAGVEAGVEAGVNTNVNAGVNAKAKAAPASPPAQMYRRNALAIGTRSAGPAPAPAATSNEPGFFAKIARSLGL